MPDLFIFSPVQQTTSGIGHHRLLISLTADGPLIAILSVVTKDLPISPRFTPCTFLSRCKFSNLTTRQPMVEFFLLTFPRFPLRKKAFKSYKDKNRTHDFRTSRRADYLLDYSGDEPWEIIFRCSNQYAECEKQQQQRK